MPKTQFYHAVKRLDPELCERFLFLLGEFTDANTSRFIRKVDGFVFRKPFFPFDLLNELLSAEKLGTLKGAFKRASADPVLSQLSPLEYDFPAGEPPPQPSIGKHGSEPGLAPNGGFPWSLVAGLALSFALIVGLWMLSGNARDRAGAAEADRVALETEWEAVSPDLDEALAIRSKAALAQDELDRLSAARGELHWAPVLRCFLPPGDSRIQILEIITHGESKDPGACEVVVKGVAEGTEPRMMADRFRQTVEEELRGIANGRSVSVRLDQLDVTPTTGPDETRASFVLIATVGEPDPSGAVNKEGQ